MLQNFKIKNKLNRTSIFIFAVFLLAIFFRLVYPKSYGIGFDQAQILENANYILSGKFTLLGPRTGPANMFTGPLIYYLSAPFVYFFGEVATIYLVPVFISIVTGISLYFLGKRYLPHKLALIMISIWGVSPWIINQDRQLWNPNFMLLSAFLIFIPLLKKKTDKFTFISLFFGAFLSFQAHFSGFLLLALGVLSILYLKKTLKLIVPIILGFFFSILPTIIFDIRHNFLNLRGLLEFSLQEKQFNFINLLADVLKNLTIISKVYGRILLSGQNYKSSFILLGFLLLAIAIIYIRNRNIKLSFLWLIGISIAYGFYNGNKSDYYFLIAVPQLLIITAYIFEKIEKKYLLAIFIFLTINSSFILLSSFKNNMGITIGNIEKIENLFNKIKPSKIIYDIDFGLDHGIKYILSDVITDDKNLPVHISYRHDLKFKGITNIGDIAVWTDKRKINKNYISEPSYFLETNSKYYLYKDLYPQNNFEPNDSYKIVVDNKSLGNLTVFKKFNPGDTLISECSKLDEDRIYGTWIKNFDDIYFQYHPDFCLKVEMIDPSMEKFEEIGIRIF